MTVSKKEKVLLVGSSFSAVPLFFELKKNNCQVFVCGTFKDDPCHLYADGSYFIDYSDKEALLKLVLTERFDYIVPSCNDYSYMSCSWVANELKLPGFDDYQTSIILHSKDAFREFTTRHSFPVPKAIELDTGFDSNLITQKLSFPLLVKPVDSFSGKGVTKVNNDSELNEAFEFAVSSSRSQKAIVEEFKEGTLHSHSAFIKDKKIIADVFVDEYCTVYPYQVNCSSISGLLTTQLKVSIRDSIEKLIDLLGLCDGLLHTQIIVDKDKFWLIETMRRCPGDLYNKLVELSTGFNYTKYFVSPFVGEDLKETQEIQAEKHYARHTISVSEEKKFFSFKNSIPSNNIQTVYLKNSGEILRPAPFDKLGITFVEFPNNDKLSLYVPKLAEYCEVISYE